MKKNNGIGGRLISALVLIPLILFVMYRMYVIAPRFFPYLGSVFLLGFILFYGSKLFHRLTASKCASCGGPLSNMGVKKVVPGLLNKDGGSNFDPLGTKVFRCTDCEKEYHELVYYSGITGEAIDHKNITDVEMYFAKTMMKLRGDLPNINNKDFAPNSVTTDEYRAIKRKLAEEVRVHNSRNGYLKNPIKIDIDE